MNEWLKDLYGHQAWADAKHWHAFEQHPNVLEDAAVRERLQHIHLVQRAFLSIARGEKVDVSKLQYVDSVAVLKEQARQYHDQVAAFLAEVTDDRLAEQVTIPWFKDPPIEITIAQALTQAAMHSHYHRAQNATRLRELGRKPPTTDLIVWYWKGKPAPRWS
jgi:uncharacterized damage-inducible protein DinB